MRRLVSLTDVVRSFGATRALKGVSFDLLAGEVHALVGENGAGKSTLMNILSGVLRPDGGRIEVDRRPVTFHSTHEAKAAGVATVFQELSLVDGLSVAENICAGRPPRRFGLIDRPTMRHRAGQALNRLGAGLSPDALTGGLMASQRQTVEIAKALDQLFAADTADGSPRVLILDEPTSALTAEEKQALFEAVRGLRAAGVGIIYISHHLDEVIALADRITVLRDGASVWTRPAAGLTQADLVRAMVGRDVLRSARRSHDRGAVVAGMEGVTLTGRLSGLTLSLHRGEVLAIAGLDGSGREWVARLLAGLVRPDAGHLSLMGAAHPGRLRAAMDQGLGYVPDDRKGLGLFLDMPIAANVLAADLGAVTFAGVVRGARLMAEGAEAIRRHGVKASSPAQPVGTLSGGNQQKVLFAKWLRRNPQILIVEEPTRGVDIGAKRDIHDALVAHARAGAAVLAVSSDLPEVLEIADRILVLHRGRLAGEVAGIGATEEAVMALAAGSLAAAE